MTMRGISLPRWISWATSALALLVIIDLTVFFLLPVQLLDVSQPGPVRYRVDAAAILFHDFNARRTGISNETRRRLHYGISLLQSKKAGTLLVAGGNRPDQGINGAGLMAEYVRSLGIPDVAVIVENSSHDSLSNLERISQIMRQHDLQSVALVSSPYHLLRLQALSIGAHAQMQYAPYDIVHCFPPLTRKDLWLSAHYNMAAYVAAAVLPKESYRWIVEWVRRHTEF